MDKNVHVLVVRLSFNSAAELDKWVASWKHLASIVHGEEPNCLTYEMSRQNDDPTKCIIYEVKLVLKRGVSLEFACTSDIVQRYVTKADLDGKHQERFERGYCTPCVDGRHAAYSHLRVLCSLAKFKQLAASNSGVEPVMELTHYTESNLGHAGR